MKKLVAILLTLAMLLVAVPATMTSAAPADTCFRFDEKGAYLCYSELQLEPSDTTVEFDLSLEVADNGAPFFQMNGGLFTITDLGVNLCGIGKNIIWDNATLSHWRHFVLNFNATGATFSVDGDVVITVPGVSLDVLNLIYFNAYPGFMLMDNITVTAKGAVVLFDDCRDMAHTAGGSSATVVNVPADSFTTDGEGVATTTREGKIGEVYEGNSYRIKFDNQNAVDHITSSVNTIFGLDGETLKLQATNGNDPSVYLDLTDEGISCNDYKGIAVIYKVPTTVNWDKLYQNIYYVCDTMTGPAGGAETTRESVWNSGLYQFTSYDLERNSRTTWKNDLKGLRLDYFESCGTKHYMNIDSIILAPTGDQAYNLALNLILALRSDDVRGIWNNYRQNFMNNNVNTFLTPDYTMCFRYAPGAMTCDSLAARFANEIKTRTGKDVTCTIYRGYPNLKNNFNGADDDYVYYTLTYKGESKIICLKTVIINDASYHDSFDGLNPQNDPEMLDMSNFSSQGVSVDAYKSNIPASSSGLAGHSNHENRVVDTPYGTFAVVPMYDTGSFGDLNGTTSTVYKIEDGKYTALWSFTHSNHTSKPNIYYAADGMVYVCCADAGNGFGSLYVGYFDPSKPFTTANQSRQNINYSEGNAPGGYGYGQPILDDTNGKIVYMFCGGGGDADNHGHFAWFVYDYKNHTFENAAMHVRLNDTYRHCYLYGFSDGADGLYVVAGRDVLLTDIGQSLPDCDYAWDEVNIFHFDDIYADRCSRVCVNEADYTENDRIMPTTSNNAHGDAYLSSDGYLHVLTSTRMHGPDRHHNTKYWEYWHTVYDVREPGAKPKVVYDMPVDFARDSEYAFRAVESANGEVYIVAMAYGSTKLEVYKVDSLTYEKTYVACKELGTGSASQMDGSLIVANNRNGSVIDNDVTIMVPTNDGGTKYKFTTVNFAEVCADGHTFGAWETKTEATCTANGLKVRTCSVCQKTESEEITKLGHLSRTVKGTAATCTEDGLTDGIYCDRCNTFTKAQTVIKATGHNYVGGECTKCHEKEPGAYAAGDINMDGAVNSKDVVRFIKYLADDETPVNEAALDTNGDTAVNNADLTHLMKYLAGLDVVLH